MREYSLTIDQREPLRWSEWCRHQSRSKISQGALQAQPVERAVTRLPGFPPNTRQMADGGVYDGAMLASKPDKHDPRLALAQIKGGALARAPCSTSLAALTATRRPSGAS